MPEDTEWYAVEDIYELMSSKKGHFWPFLDVRTVIDRSIVARCGAADGGGLLLKLV